MTFFSAGPAGEIYAFNRDDETRGDVREFCERQWSRFRPYCPDEDHFLTDARANFHSRTWEMILACGLLDRGFTLERPPTDGPDIKLVGGPVAAQWPVWIEATTVELGTGADRAHRIEHPIAPELDEFGNETAQMVRVTTKPEKTALRYTSAIASKRKQHGEFRARGIVAADDVFVIAINGALLHDYSRTDTDPEILKSVYPIGDAFVSVKVGDPDSARWHYKHRGHVTKASGVAIPTSAFLDDDYAGVSALLYSKAWACDRKVAGPDSMLTIHNARAANRLPDGFFPFGREARAADGTIEWVNHPRSE